MIPMNDFKAEPEDLRDEIMDAVRRVIESGWYVLGRECETFEASFSRLLGLDYAVGVGNGMDAIEILLRALGIGAGDEVITTSMTAFATVLAILRCGATPVLADIEPDTALLDRASVERCISKRTRAIVPVHLYGQVRDLDLWAELATKNSLHLIEDCAQAHLARWHGRSAGTFGIGGAFSFYPTKNLGALGDGGLLTTSDAEVAALTRRLRNYGQSERYHHPHLGLNSRLDELQAAILSVRLTRLEAFTARRRAVAAAYDAGITNPSVLPMSPPIAPEAHVHHLYVVRTARRDALAAHLSNLGVQTHIHYPVVIHHQEACRELRCDPKGLSASETHAATCLSLPCHPQLDDDAVSRIIDAVNAYR